MQATVSVTIYDQVLDFLATAPSQQAILEFQLAPDLQVRIEGLLEKNREGGLSPDEEAEVHEYLDANDLMMLLKAKVHASMNIIEQA